MNDYDEIDIQPSPWLTPIVLLVMLALGIWFWHWVLGLVL